MTPAGANKDYFKTDNTMSKFKKGDFVHYAGCEPALKSYFKSGLTVRKVSHPGESIGNGETNCSGEDMYTCHPKGKLFSSSFLFRESNLVKA